MFKHLLAVLLIAFSSLSFAADTVNINTADAETIASVMAGVGETKAAAIVAYRNNHGSFKSIDDLVLVKGIGEKTVESNRDVMMVEELQ